MGFWGAAEQARLALVRADVVDAVTKTRDEFERRHPGQSVFVIRGWVTSDQQAAVYADSLKSGYRAAPADKSYHPIGAAVDLGIDGLVRDAAVDQKDPLYRDLASIGESFGLRAGFNFKSGLPDPYHFEARETLDVAKGKWDALVKERLQRSTNVGVLALAAIPVVILIFKLVQGWLRRRRK